MARVGKLELTWLPSSKRWKKKRGGKEYYYPALRGETKEQSYRRCLREWRAKRAELDGADAAKLDTLHSIRARLAALEQSLRLIAEPFKRGVAFVNDVDVVDLPKPDVKALLAALPDDEPKEVTLAGYAERVAERVERIYGVRPEPVAPAQPAVERFLDEMRASRKPGRVLGIELAMREYRKSLGTKPVEDAQRADVVAFRQALVDRKLDRATVNLRLATVAQFYRWLDAERPTPNYRPPNFRGVRLTVAAKAVEAAELGAVRQALRELDGKPLYKLVALLACNCGMTQADVSALRADEVDSEAQTIKRLRTKTETTSKNPPVVSYKLWPTTWALLAKVGSLDGGLVVTRPDGSPLLTGSSDPYGTALRRITGLGPRDFRKATAFAIRKRAGAEVADLFLAHAPATVGDKHYFGGPQEQLDDAVAWLGKQLGQGETARKVPPKPKPRKPR